MPKYIPKTRAIEAVFLDKVTTALVFLRTGEFSVVKNDGVFLVLPDKTTIFAPIGECYLVRWPTGIDIMDKDDFESQYQEHA